MTLSRKRRKVAIKGSRAECPFSAKIYDPKDEKKKTKRRRTEDGEDNDASQRTNLQLSPFSPIGKFKTNPNMDLYYQVEPPKKWTDMTRYNSFVRKLPLPSL